MKKIEFEGKIVEQFIDFADGYSVYADVYDEKNKTWLTESITEFEGKRVRVTLEFIEEETE